MSVLFAFLTSLAVTAFAIPSIIKVAELKHLFDMPDDQGSNGNGTRGRKSHAAAVPTLGGMAIFAGMIFFGDFLVGSKRVGRTAIYYGFNADFIFYRH